VTNAPARPPQRPILLFDGDCGFCTTSATWAHHHLPGHPAIQPWQHADLDAYRITEAECASAVQWIDQRGMAHAGAAAIARVLQDSGGAWRLLGTAGSFPPGSWLSRATYTLIARHRHRLPGGTPACALAQRD
jgi:predicted DCC family thiol-disulfide oxidoreductase YuxK